MTGQKKLFLLTAGPVWPGCLRFVKDFGALPLSLLIAPIPDSPANTFQTVPAARPLGVEPAFPGTASGRRLLLALAGRLSAHTMEEGG